LGDPAPLLGRCLDVAPHYLPACSDYAVLLINRNMHIEALPCLERLHAHDPNNAMVAALLAKCLGQMGDFDRAIELHQTAGEAFDAEPALLLTYAEALKHAGRREDSVTIHRICLEADPGQGMAWWGLANVKTEPFSADDVRTMRAQLARTDLAPRDRYHMHYALGRAYEQARDYAASFAEYAAGAALKKAEVAYDDAGLPELGRRMKAFFTADRFAATAGCGDQDPAPIFILGLPRAGSTLVEQILASHSQVEGTVEMPEISNLVREIGLTPQGMIYPECLADYEPEDVAALGARFLERSKVYRKTGRPFFIDKMPANWAHIGLIHTILPNAKIIDARREPMANCFAAYKQLFGHGVHYSYDFGDLARYYKAYLDRMAHFDAVLPGRIHRVQYEDMVNDTEAQVRALLAYCGLDFEPACLRFWESKRAVATPSAEQVRQPIFREGLEQWRHYEPWLGPLREALA
jgi:tetratricopeptide (TPR) repeat protein